MNTQLKQVVCLAWLLFASSFAIAQVQADFSVDKTAACSPLLVRFSDMSTGNITSWHWSFGNGNVSTQQNPGAVYLQPGYKTVQLIVSDGITSDTMVKTNFIQVYADPEANFGATITEGCTPFQVCFNDSSIAGSGAITSWTWDFGDGNSSTLPNPCNIYDEPGSYTVTLLIKDTNGCQSQIVYPNYVVASDTIIADFTADVTSACQGPLDVQFTNTSTSSSTFTSAWTFGDGNVSSSKSPQHTYTAGVYDVSLIVKNSFGCRDTITKPAYIAIEPLVADFSSDVTQGCVGTPVTFTDLSTSGPNAWFWDFGDGGTSTGENPTHTYTTPGTYTVKLRAANSGSCMDSVSKTAYITISNSPTAAFTGTNLSGCKTPHTVAFQNSSTNAVSWFWDFGDGNTSTQQSPAHTYTTTGSFDVSLTVTNADSCTNTLTLPAYVNVIAPEAQLFADTVQGCLPLTVNFADSSTAQNIVSWFWDFGDGQTSTQQHPVHTYTAEGDYDVSLVIVNNQGCTDTIVRSSYVKAGNKPVANFTANTTDICLFGSVTFTDLSQGNVTDWLWLFGDGNSSLEEQPTYAYSDTGRFTITLIASSYGCRDTFTIADYIHVAPPDARFGVQYNCADPYTVSFSDNSLAPDTWEWSFGDGTTSTDQNPVHTYAARGKYNVNLLVTDSISGCYDIEAIEVHITDPVADFGADTTIGCAPFAVQFSDSSIDGVSYQWLAGTRTSTQKNPSFTYNTPGIYDVRLIITDAHGCNDTIIKPNYITVLGPTALFTGTPRNGCAPLPVQFTDTSAAFMSPIVSWKWTFGDGDTSAVQNPNHLYNTTGKYRVRLTVTDANGCSNTLSRNNYIQPTFPTPAFTGDTLTCLGKPANFTSGSAGTGMSYLWDFGDGDTSTAANPSHIYSALGTYTVSLTVTDVNGCDSTIVKPDFVKVSMPEADFFADSTFTPCPPLLVNFTDNSTSDVVSWHWDFGDGSTSNLKNPSHVYLSPGNFAVTLVTKTDKGCYDTIVKADFVVVLGPSGTFTFTPKNGCLGNEVEFTAVTQNTATRTWDFGDGILQAAGDTVTHTYATYGVRYPVLILDDGLGCIHAVSSADSVVTGMLQPDFEVSPQYICKAGTVTFTDSSFGFPALTTWKWFFGDGDSSTLQHPTHHYSQSGYFDVTLIVSNGSCTDTLVKPAAVYVDPGPQAAFSASATEGCLPHKVFFTDSSVSGSPIVSYVWDFGNGLTDTLNNTAVSYTDTGSYQVQLVITAASGCQDTMIQTITVHPLPVVTTGADTAICLGESIQLNASGAQTYLWNPAAGLDSNNIASPVATPLDTTTYIVTGTDSNGCTAVDTIVVTVNPLPAVDAGQGGEICLGTTLELNGSGDGHYMWAPANTLSCTTCPTTVASPTETTVYTLEMTNQYNCTSADTVHVIVRERPEGIVSTDTAICKGESVQLIATGGDNYAWYPAAGLDCTTCPEPLATPDTTTMYELIVFNEFGCKTVDSVTITVNPNPVVEIVGTDSICSGESVTLTATGGGTYTWAADASLSCLTCASPVATPTETTTYVLTVANGFGCTTMDSFTVTVMANPSVNIIDDVTICLGDDVKLETTFELADRFTWTPSDGLSNANAASPLAAPDKTTTYRVIAETNFGCAVSDEVTVTIIDKVEVQTVGDTAICYGASVQLHTQAITAGNQGITYVWNPVNQFNDVNLQNPVVTPETSREYMLLAYSGSCVPDTHKVNVTVNALPELTPAAQAPVVENTPVKLVVDYPENIVAYEWTPANGLSCTNCETPELTAVESSTYTVNVTDENGCKASVQVPVTVIGVCGDDIFVPNSFTPNNDGVNDQLYLRGRGLSALKVFRVFDRWGNLVFETNDMNEGWNGTYKQKMMDTGVFVYYYEAVCSNGLDVNGKGNVTLIR